MQVFDAHFHIIEQGFPLVANHGFKPAEYTVDDYLTRMNNYDLLGGVVVSGSFQALDQSYLLNALEKLGPNFVGVTQLSDSVSDQTLIQLNAAGVRAIRFNFKRGNSESLSLLDNMARRVYELVGWHVELYIDSIQLEAIYRMVISWPSVSIDHLGLSAAGLATVIKLAEKNIKIKATGFGRVDFDIKPALIDIYAANPCCLMFGTDLPSTRAPRAYSDEDLLLIIEALGEQKAQRVLVKNAMEFYRLA